MRLSRLLLPLALLCAEPAGASRADWLDQAFDGNGGALETPQIRPPQPAAIAGDSPSQDERVWVEIYAPDKFARSRVADAGVSIEEVRGATAAGIATPETLAKIRLNKAFVIQKVLRLKDFPAGDEAYHTFDEVETVLRGVTAAHRDLVSFIEIGRSLRGKALMGLRFNTTAKGLEKSSKPGIVFLGTHHAREHLSTEIPLMLARWLGDNRAKPEVHKLLEARDIFIIPLVNPDGAAYDIHDEDAKRLSRGKKEYRMHRKNLRRNANGSIGVDLNRNYGFHWGEGGASPNPGDDTFRGPSAFSEPETQAVKKLVESRDNIRVLLSYHTFSELILYPWGHTYDSIPDGQALKAYRAMAGQMAQWTGYKPQQSSDLYIASGDTTDWAWGTHKIFSFTFELTPKSMWNGGFYPGPGVIEPTFQKNIQPALYLIDLADDPYRAASAGASAAAPTRSPERFSRASDCNLDRACSISRR
ncbi:MAG: zinc carboxypeptidase [Elusimicrobia bacterium]|nr:zinc carboxypeptidase [Elusimicrobiota bacterium]